MGGYSQLKSNLTISADITEDLNLLYTANYIQGLDGGDLLTTDDIFITIYQLLTMLIMLGR